MKGLELNEKRRRSAIAEFMDQSSVLIDSREKITKALEVILEHELARNEREYEWLVKETYADFVNRNQTLAVEQRGKEVAEEIKEYFKKLESTAEQFDVSDESPLILKKATDDSVEIIEINGEPMYTLYKFEVGSKLPTKAGYFILHKDGKSIRAVYTDDCFTDYVFTNIMNENDVYTISPKDHIEPIGVRNNGNKTVVNGVDVFYHAIDIRNELEKDELENLSFAFEDNAENSKYNIDELVNLANRAFSDHVIIKCKDCGDFFALSQERCDRFTKELGFPIPKRCQSCRDRRRNEG